MIRDTDFAFIRGLVYEHSRINLGAEKRDLVTSRLGRRLRATRTASIAEYCSLLRTSSMPRELPHLIDAISTNHTHFFRETPHFDYLTDTILPEYLRSSNSRTKEFHIWSAACSSGEEPYTIAIAIDRFLRSKNSSLGWRIEASDISYTMLDRAKRAIYPKEAISMLSTEEEKRYFDKGIGAQEGKYRVVKALRERTSYHRLNLLTDQYPFSRTFQLIFCRNVMIYFDRETQSELIARLHRIIEPGGHLFVGHSESLAGIQHQFEYIRPAIYRRPVD